jgi:hypothetical protein
MRRRKITFIYRRLGNAFQRDTTCERGVSLNTVLTTDTTAARHKGTITMKKLLPTAFLGLATSR